ncbi:hypothetical protein ACKE5C_01795 [Aneurinibacillus thermoaerophilus]|uniref:Biotin-requiring enzyme n=1 Tax=Aneurinibacillus thermoaerophilus TaxID=143495 RepID=A0ABX8YCK1_ANETH|nr:hypothetical protein [Aneurinibacillus thermoaerophilus]QYY43070.1 hypothetical protein K3F53_01780 [Aneurinibacillus thermoaerophilus]
MVIQYPVLSPYYGKVEKIIHPSASYFYEWETLFLIRTSDGMIEEIVADTAGYVYSYEVANGDRIIPGMVLAYIREEGEGFCLGSIKLPAYGTRIY